MSQIINPVNERNFLFVAFDGDIFAVHDEDAAEAEGAAEGFGESRVLGEPVNLLFDLEKDLLAGEIMFIPELSKRQAVNVGNPEYWRPLAVREGKRARASLAEILTGAALSAFLDGMVALTAGTDMFPFFLT